MTVPPSNSSSSSSDSSRPALILYAEDNEINVMLVTQIIDLRPDWKLEVARSGEEALEMVARIRPRLALIDMNLGDMSGLEFMSRLQAQGLADGLIKLALSADALDEQIERALKAGFDAYLTKPLDVEGLLRCLDGYLSTV